MSCDCEWRMQSIWRKSISRSSQMSSKFRKSFVKWTLIMLNRRLRLWKKQKISDEESVSSMMKIEEKNNINYVVKGNALEQKSTRKKADIKSLEESLLVLYKKSWNCSLLTFPLIHSSISLIFHCNSLDISYSILEIIVPR